MYYAFQLEAQHLSVQILMVVITVLFSFVVTDKVCVATLSI